MDKNDTNVATGYEIVFEKFAEEVANIQVHGSDTTIAELNEIDELRRFALDLGDVVPMRFVTA